MLAVTLLMSADVLRLLGTRQGTSLYQSLLCWSVPIRSMRI